MRYSLGFDPDVSRRGTDSWNRMGIGGGSWVCCSSKDEAHANTDEQRLASESCQAATS